MHATVAQPEPRRDEDQFVVFHGVTWKDFEILLAIRGDAPVPRMTYLEGELELMSPSRSHELIKTTIGRLLEAYALERRIRMNGYGSWTLRAPLRERGLEPDECYAFNRTPGDDDRPDLAIEVVWTSGSIDKLEVYRGLEIPEVWRWKGGAIQIFALRDDRYVPVDRSAFLPDLDPALVARFAEHPDQSEAIFQFLEELRQGR